MNEQEKIPISYFVNLILPYKFFIAGSLALLLGLAWVYLQTQSNNYQIKSSMMLSISRIQDSGGELFGEKQDYIGDKEDEIGIIESYNFIEKTVLKMDVGISYYQKKWIAQSSKAAKLNPYKVVIDSSHNQLVKIPIFITPTGEDKILVRVDASSAWSYDPSTFELIEKINDEDIFFEKEIRSGEFIETPHLRFQVIVNDKYPFNSNYEYFFKINALGDLVDKYQGKLKLKAKSSDSNILQLSSTGPLISLEEDFLNIVMNTYIQNKSESVSGSGKNTLKYIESQLKMMKDSLRIKEAEKVIIQREAGVTAGSDILGTSQIEQLMAEKADLKVQIIFIEDIKATLENENSNITPSTDNISDALMRSFILELSRLNQEKAKLATSQKETATPMITLTNEIKNVRASLKRSVNNNLSALNTKLRSANNQIGRINANTRKLPEKERKLRKIEREVLLIQNTVQLLETQKTKRALIEKGRDENLNLVLDKARPSSTEPVSPNRMLIFGLAFVMGLALPIAFVIIKELLHTKITGQRDLDLMTDIPTLGFVVHNESSSLRITSETQNTAFAECFRSLRVQIKYFHNKGTKQLVGFTSTWPNEGKSFCASNYAAVMALSGKKTLLVDLDLRSPSLQDYYLFGKGPGVTEYLQESAEDWKSLLRNSDIDTLKLLPAGSITFKPLDLLESDRFENMLQEMRDNFDVIILDTPPIGQTADYNIVKEYLDFTSYIVRYNKTDKESLKQINMLYDTGIVTNIGLIINGVTEAFFNKYGEKGTYYGQYIGREYV